MTTTTAPIAAATSTLEISDLALDKAEAINLCELLESDLVADTVIRSICIIRKTLLSKPITQPEDQQLEAKLTALFHAIGYENRDVAHQMQRDRIQQAGPAVTNSRRPAPLPLPLPPSTAAKLGVNAALDYAAAVIKSALSAGKRSIKTDDLHGEIERRHLSGGLQWHSTDLIVLEHSTRRWHKTIATAMEKLADDEQVMWSAKSNCWVLLDF